MKRNYKFQMYQQPFKGAPAGKEDALPDPIALPGPFLSLCAFSAACLLQSSRSGLLVYWHQIPALQV